MYFFDRNSVPIPQWFLSRHATELNLTIAKYMTLPEKERAQTRIPIVWKEPVDESITIDLRQISHGKCAFCEEARPDTKPYRFRPPAYAEPNDGSLLEGSHYLWTCWDWQNFYPICSDCLPGQKNLFPLVEGERIAPLPSDFEYWLQTMENNEDPKAHIEAHPQIRPPLKKERPLFLAPGRTNDMATYFTAAHDGRLLGKDKAGRAKATIEVYQLNRPGLAKRRADHADQRIGTILEAFRGVVTLGPNEWDRAFDFNGGSYSTHFYLHLRNIALRASPAQIDKSTISPSRIRSSFEKALEGSSRDAFKQALEDYFLSDVKGDIAEHDMLSGSSSAQPEPIGVLPDPDFVSLRLIEHYKTYPRLKTISVNNFKSLEDISLNLPEKIDRLSPPVTKSGTAEPQAPCLILLGENATGKSSLLEALCLASVNGRLRDKLGQKPGRLILNPVYMGSQKETKNRQSNVRLEFHASENKHHPVSLELKIDPKAGFTSAADPAKCLRPLVFAYGAHRLFGDDDSSDSDLANIVTLFDNDKRIRNPEKWLIEQFDKDETIFNTVIASLRLVIQVDGHFENISVETDEDGNKYCQINLTKSGTRSGDEEANADYLLPLRFSVASSGYKVVLGLICDIFAGIMKQTGCRAHEVHTYPAMVLIDEVEAHLHPRWKMQIITGLRKALPDVTFIISSHDPLCVRGTFKDEVAVLNRYSNYNRQRASGDLREAVEVITDLPNLGNYTVDQLLTSDLFSMFSADDIRTEKSLANIADKIVRLKKEREALAAAGDDSRKLETEEIEDGLSEEEKQVFEHFQSNIAEALPIGNDEVFRLVQEAVAEFLVLRRKLNSEGERQARKKAKQAIIDKLAEFIS